jgi:hypothetical protein
LFGDVEANPGPSSGLQENTRETRQITQKKLSFGPSQESQQTAANRYSPWTNTTPVCINSPSSDKEIIKILKDFKQEIKTDVDNINRKLDRVLLSNENLETKREKLKSRGSE